MSQSNKNILWLGMVSFINDTASKIILPILPLFIKEIGGSGFAIGIISGLGASVASIFKMFAGFWSDKTGRRKPFVFWGYFLSSAAKFFFIIAQRWPHVLILRTTERLGKGLRSAPRDAILAASTKKETRGKGFGIHRAMDSGGSVLGAFIALFLFWNLGFGFKNIFLTAGIISFMSLVPLILVKEGRTESKTADLKLRLESLPISLKLFITVATLFALGNFSYMFFILRSQAYFEGAWADRIPIILYIFYNTSYTVFAIPAGMLSDKIGRKLVLFAGYGLFGLVCLGFVFSQSLAFFIILFILFGLNYALVEANERAFVSDMAPEDLRGTTLGTFHMLISLVALPSGIIAGFLWDINTTFTFIYGAIVSLMVLILFSVLCKKKCSS